MFKEARLTARFQENLIGNRKTEKESDSSSVKLSIFVRENGDIPTFLAISAEFSAEAKRN